MNTDLSSSLQDKYVAFGRTHPSTRRVINGTVWHYISCGQGDNTILLLPGAPGRADTSFEQIPYDDFSKAEYDSRLAVHIDFDRHHHFSSKDAPPHDMLIIEADNDTLVPPTERAMLRSTYPHARVYTFYDSAHSAWVTHYDDYMQQIVGFLSSS